MKDINKRPAPKSSTRPGGAPFNIGFFLVAFLLIMGAQEFLKDRNLEVISFAKFQKLLEEKRISEIVIGDTSISGKLKQPKETEKSLFKTNKVEPAMVELLNKYNVDYSRKIESKWFSTLLSWILPTLIFFGFWIFLMRKMAQKSGMGGGAGLMSIGKSKAKIYVEQDTQTTFDDVAGIDEAKQELQEVVEFLTQPEKYGVLGAKLPKGVLLVGPPGTGKTLVARAIAGEAKVPFFFISGSDFVEMFVGVGAARVRDLFEQAKKKSPCIVFIDELDALGKSRSNRLMGGHDEKEQTLNQLLVEMDGFSSQAGIVLLGATNRPEVLDPALLRAGRFDRQIVVDRPDKKGREEILGVHSKNIVVDESLELEKVAALTPGFTGADLANLVNEAAIVATRRSAKAVNLSDFENAIERLIAGLEKRNRILNQFERKVVAYHEMGHAVVASVLPGVDPVQKISIIPRSIGALGYTIQRPTEDRFLMTKQELKNKMVVLLGGRAAEKIIFSHLSTGASDDLQKITDIARSIVTRYGMNEDLGNVTYEKEQKSYLGEGFIEKSYGPSTAEKIDIAVKKLTSEALARAISILEINREVLIESADELLEKESFSAEDFGPYFKKLKDENTNSVS